MDKMTLHCKIVVHPNTVRSHFVADGGSLLMEWETTCYDPQGRLLGEHFLGYLCPQWLHLHQLTHCTHNVPHHLTIVSTPKIMIVLYSPRSTCEGCNYTLINYLYNNTFHRFLLWNSVVCLTPLKRALHLEYHTSHGLSS